MNTWNYYKKNWTTPFEGGPKKIWTMTGNSDSSDFHTALYIEVYETFNTWQEFARYLRKSKKYDTFLTMDLDTEEQMTFKNSKAFFKHITSDKQADPVFYVFEDNPLVQWLMRVRGV